MPIAPFPTLTRDHPPTTSMARDRNSNRRTPPAPPTTTVHRAQRPRRCAQECGADRPMSNHARCHHQWPQRHATTTTPTSGRAPPAPPQPLYTGPKGPGTAHKSAALVTESPTLHAANTHDGAQPPPQSGGANANPLNHPSGLEWITLPAKGSPYSSSPLLIYQHNLDFCFALELLGKQTSCSLANIPVHRLW